MFLGLPRLGIVKVCLDFVLLGSVVGGWMGRGKKKNKRIKISLVFHFSCLFSLNYFKRKYELKGGGKKNFNNFFSIFDFLS